ncbi:MAG TPA: glycogen/starch/alpha-glucan phosphorylase [Opitutales bacterium]|nr:glycogen/starch/alpha-glucan phosphorylase [Opitutales bacterium]
MPQKKSSNRNGSAAVKASAPTAGFNFNIEASAEGMRTSILNHLKYSLARDTGSATRRDWWISTSHAVQDRILERFIDTMAAQSNGNAKRVYYLSLEYLMGRMLHNNIVNSGLYVPTRDALKSLNLDIESLFEVEEDMGLGNGGLGRLAACFMDSLATLQLPAVGYGIRYQFGLFRQSFVDGKQIEQPDDWCKFGSPWEIVRPEYEKSIRIFGRINTRFDNMGNSHHEWVDYKELVGLPYDIPIVGYGAKTVNFMRLWESKTGKELDLDIFNRGSYVDAVREKSWAESVSKVLYPNDSSENGRELRLVQQYFFVACSIYDIMRRYEKMNSNFEAFPDKVAMQLNDTHPAIAVAELMRQLVDEHSIGWDKAWELTRKTLAYTNHTLLPEALERWPVPLFERVLPRHLQIIYEINRRFLSETVEARWPGDNDKKRDLSLIEEGNPKMVRMAYMSVVGSHSVNGVAAIHTKLLREKLFPEFDALYPNLFNNKTNGITPRRWLKQCNPALSALADKCVGIDWPADLDKLRGLEKFAGDKAILAEFMAIKRANKEVLAKVILKETGIAVSSDALFDVQIKRLHEYKRQHLNLLHILTRYRRLLHNPGLDVPPRVVLFGAKAAPGYYLAKRIIEAINLVGNVINNDARINGKLKVVFLPNYRVSLAEKIIPAADLSEQISTAGKEASGTGNMKLALNGALTIGTLDGANIEIGEEVGSDNIFIFGLTVDEVEALRAKGYNPYDYYYANPELREVVDWIGSDYFTPGLKGELSAIRDSLLAGGDPFLCLADYESYVRAQERVDEAYKDTDRWAKMALLNTARVGKFSSDRTIREYASEIWNLPTVQVP